MSSQIFPSPNSSEFVMFSKLSTLFAGFYRLSAAGVVLKNSEQPLNMREISSAVEPQSVILITGGAGFLGQHIVKLIQERRPDVKEIRVFDIKPYLNQLDHPESKPIKSFVGDVRSLHDLLKAFDGVDTVIHTAGLISYGTFPDLEGMQQINVKGTKNVIEACVKQSVPHLVYTSTVDVVIGFEEIINGDEDNTTKPRKFLFPGYPQTKSEAEKCVLQANGTPLSK
ncbi:3 beta-hydroxysteroid dehydrogenase type 7-like, partial [Lingula anatina]|uniref:3 beta-hydroxysteroid dehydrogenase type 7-like n=1 Tax=Lingula anatina TaxID=7574 RepID=A0A1S3KGV9_LINAN